ncbi:MarR family transcriptional regulator [Lentibacter algarum]|uniref:MarR family winged helix-turn-helix transcriptional regulator n=1 Tax=Lentibacter algarum TaxID=576131 RepID=UPI001C0694F4|nr:MarR family transcriptional regulator [Lentibacter algarum]MBU2981076.1 MarR family transcriptional regulator [Lentibacter algarum]
MSDKQNALAIALVSEILSADQLLRNRLSKVLPNGMEISHFSVLTHLEHANSEKSPAQLASTFHVTRGAMTNTISKLEWAGYVHVRPDWDDARRKFVAISPAGIRARNTALSAISPVIAGLVQELGSESVRAALPVLRELRAALERN